MASAKDDKTFLEGVAAAFAKSDNKSHIRFVGHPSEDENSATVVFGKQFFRGKWVPISNLDGTNPDKKALPEEQLLQLLENPAFQVGSGDEAPVPGMLAGEDVVHEEA